MAPKNKSINDLLDKTDYKSVQASAYGPVPLELANRLSKDIGRTIYIKREDMVDSFGCGNKLRKLHYIVESAKMQHIDTLISIGSLPSNQCKAVAKVATQNGMRAHLIYGGDKQHKPVMAQGSYLITTLFNPEISWFEYSSWVTLEEQLTCIFEQEKEKGYNPCIIKSGASNWPGILGSIELGIELAQQLLQQNIHKADIICAAGSGGTAVGLQIVSEIFGLDYKIHGMCIGEPSANLYPKCQKLKEECYRFLKISPPSPVDLELYDFGLGAGYDTPTPEELNTMRRVILDYGLILDHNYMLKTFIGMKKLLQDKWLRADSALVLLHSGGQTGLFDGNAEMQKWYCQEYKFCVK